METFLDNGSTILGDPNAKVILVEFGDYQCHFCNVFFHSTEGDILKIMLKLGKVKMIFKDYNIIGPDSVNASMEPIVQMTKDCFGNITIFCITIGLEKIMDGHHQRILLKFAQEVGLDADKWSECMINGPHSKTIVASNEDAKSLELTGTPAFFVIGPDGETTRLFGAQPY